MTDKTYSIRFPWRTVQATAPSRWRAYYEIVKHETLELVRGSAYAHARPSALRYALGGPPPHPSGTPGVKGENYRESIRELAHGVDGRAAAFRGAWTETSYSAGDVVTQSFVLYQARVATSDDPSSDAGQATWEAVYIPIWLYGDQADPNDPAIVEAVAGSLYTHFNSSVTWLFDGMAWSQLALSPISELTLEHADGVDSVLLDGTQIKLERQDGDGIVRSQASLQDGLLTLTVRDDTDKTRAQVIGDAGDALQLVWLDTDGTTTLAQVGLSSAGVAVVVGEGLTFRFNGNDVATTDML